MFMGEGRRPCAPSPQMQNQPTIYVNIYRCSCGLNTTAEHRITKGMGGEKGLSAGDGHELLTEIRR